MGNFEIIFLRYKFTPNILPVHNRKWPSRRKLAQEIGGWKNRKKYFRHCPSKLYLLQLSLLDYTIEIVSASN